MHKKDDKIILNEILISDNIINKIINNIDILLNIIPEIKSMIGFDHNHPHHHLDVWNHTLLALSISECDFDIRLTLLLHDIGKPYCYQDGNIRKFVGHPIKSKEISEKILNRLGYSQNYVCYICYLIENHDNLITLNDIKNNYELSFKRYIIQYCDALAHNPDKIEIRKKYLNKILNNLELFDSDVKQKVKNKVKYNI